MSLKIGCPKAQTSVDKDPAVHPGRGDATFEVNSKNKWPGVIDPGLISMVISGTD